MQRRYYPSRDIPLLFPEARRLEATDENPVARGVLERIPVRAAERADGYFLIHNYRPAPAGDPPLEADVEVEEFDCRESWEREIGRWLSDSAWLSDDEGGSGVPAPRPRLPPRPLAAEARASEV